MSQQITTPAQRFTGKFNLDSERRSLRRGLEHSNTLMHFKNLDFFPFPEAGYINTEFAFNARNFFQSNHDGLPVSVRYDFENSGSWQTDFMAEPIIYHKYLTGGRKIVNMQAKKGAIFSEVVTREIYVREGLRIGESLLSDIVFTPDASSMVILSSSRIKILGIETGDTLLVGGYEEDISVMKMAGNGSFLATGTHHGTIKLWHPVTGECLNVIKAHDGGVLFLEISHDGNRIVSYGTDSQLCSWHSDNGTLAWKMELGRSFIKSLALSGDGKEFAIGSELKTIFTGSLVTGEIEHKYEYDNSWIDKVVYSTAGNRLLATIRNGDVARIIDVGHQLTLAEPGNSDQILNMSMSASGQIAMAATKDHRVKVWDLTKGQLICDFYSADDWIFNDPFSPAQPYIACRGWDNSIKVYDYRNGSCYAIFLMPEGYLKASEFHPKRKMVAVGGTDNKIKLWNLATGEVESSYDTGYVWPKTISFSADGNQMAFPSDEKTVQIWQIDTVTFNREVCMPEDRIKQVCYQGKGEVILIRGEHTLSIYDVESDRFLQSFEGNNKIIKSAAMSPDGKFLISCGLDFGLKLWNLTDGTVYRDYAGLTAMASEIKISEDNHFILCRSEIGQFAVWDLATGRLLWTISNPQQKITAFAISNDGLMIATAIRNDLYIWATVTGNSLGLIGSHDQTITAIAFHPKSKMVATGGLDNLTKLWSLADQTVLATIKGGASVKISADGVYLMNGFGGELRIWNIHDELRINC
ncbi:MAG: WD40 repeat domain-containing protein [Bacteroidetes bacterium]|nr:WD40 repeat domain-containing protein [Bacteroidota bacterium]